MSSIPYNYGKYINDKVALRDQGHVSASKQIQSPASAGSRGLAKTTQFTNDRTQMQMGNTTMSESIIEIRNILNRIDGVNVPVQEDDGDERAIAAMKVARDQDETEDDTMDVKIDPDGGISKAKDSDKSLDSKEETVEDFVKSFFDYTTNQFPKGETAVLTSVEKKFGDGSIKTAQETISKLMQNKDPEIAKIKKLAGI